jgi:hypothetical protein
MASPQSNLARLDLHQATSLWMGRHLATVTGHSAPSIEIIIILGRMDAPYGQASSVLDQVETEVKKHLDISLGLAAIIPDY